MVAGLAAMVEDIGIGAAGVFEGIGEDGEAIECTVGVDRPRDLRRGCAEEFGEAGLPQKVAVRISNDAAERIGLFPPRVSAAELASRRLYALKVGCRRREFGTFYGGRLERGEPYRFKNALIIFVVVKVCRWTQGCEDGADRRGGTSQRYG